METEPTNPTADLILRLDPDDDDDDDVEETQEMAHKLERVFLYARFILEVK